MDNNELKHYGVVGMKWGVRRARRASSSGNAEKGSKIYSKTFAKSVKKINSMKNMANKTNLKSAKLQKKAFKKENNATTEKQFQKARKQQFKSNKLRLQSAKLEKKAMKFEKKMAKEFSTVKMSEINKEQLELGKKYSYMLMRG